MKELLAAIKTELRNKMTQIRPGDVFITPHENYIPATARPPCIGIKDGPVSRRELAGGMQESTLEVELIVFVQLYKDEASVMGDDGAGKSGVLDLTDSIHQELDENLLDIGGMQDAFSPSEQGSQLFGDDKESLQRKIIKYQFIKEEPRP